jgi:hypothetical protein
VERALAILSPHDCAVIDEGELQEWVDAAYAPIAASWRAQVGRALTEARTAVVAANRPLDTHEELADLFDEQFDGSEVVPVDLEARYQDLMDERPLEAPALRVPVAAQQAARLRRAGRLQRRRAGAGSYLVADLPYDSERGLQLRFRDDDA